MPLFRRWKTASFGGIEMLGDAEFRARTLETLQLLSSHSCFELVQGHVALIKQGKRSGMKASVKRPTFTVGRPTWMHSVSWYAGAIAHDAYHSKLYREARAQNDGREPATATWTGTEAEKKCLIFQRQVLIDLGADPNTIGYIEKQLENPGYAGRNMGVGGWLDYLKRWW